MGGMLQENFGKKVTQTIFTGELAWFWGSGRNGEEVSHVNYVCRSGFEPGLTRFFDRIYRMNRITGGGGMPKGFFLAPVVFREAVNKRVIF